MNPIYKHHCNKCKYIGTTAGSHDNERTDWYVCLSAASCSNIGSIIGRYGDVDSEYWSCPINILDNSIYDISIDHRDNKHCLTETRIVAQAMLSRYRQSI